MEKRVTCPSCEKAMNVKIWSETLTQVLRCSSCNKKFTYNPSKEPVEEKPEVPGENKTGEKSGDATVSKLIGKGIKNGFQMATAPVKTAKREMDKLVDSMNTIANAKPPDAVTSMLSNRNGKTDNGNTEEPEGEKQRPAEKPSGPRATSKSVRCPSCSRVFQAGLPDNEKQTLTTKCPDCSNIFSFDRDALPVLEEPAGPYPSGTEGNEITEDEDFAIPLELKEKMAREQIAQQESDDADPFVGGMRLTPPPEPLDSFRIGEGKKDKHDAWGSGEDDSLELAPEPRSRKGSKGRLLSVACPYCTESFGTPAPKTRGKVICPICEEPFTINSHGEYIAKKALGNFTGGLARVFGVKAIRNYQETFRDSLEGIALLRDSHDLKHHMGSLSGKAGFLLLVVSILGMLFAGSLLLSIPGANEGNPSGDVVLSGTVISGLDLLEGATVNITDLGLQDTTNSDGGFMFEGVEAGDHTIEVTASEKGKLVVQFTIGTKDAKGGSKRLDDLVLPESGTETRDDREEKLERAGMVLGFQAAFIFLVSLLALMGSLLAFQGKRFHATLFLAGISIVSIGFFIGLVLAIFSVILVMLGKKEFIS